MKILEKGGLVVAKEGKTAFLEDDSVKKQLIVPSLIVFDGLLATFGIPQANACYGIFACRLFYVCSLLF